VVVFIFSYSKIEVEGKLVEEQEFGDAHFLVL
jgi:hypothetical protein